MKATRSGTVMAGLGIGMAVLGIALGGSVRADEARTMTVAQTQQTMDAYAEALLGGDAYETYLADDVVLTVVGAGQEVTGRAATKLAIDALHHEQFNAAPEIKTVVVGAGTAALEADFVGTQTGEFAGIAATGKEVDVPYSVFYELADGEITALRIYALADGLAQQLTAES